MFQKLRIRLAAIRCEFKSSKSRLLEFWPGALYQNLLLLLSVHLVSGVISPNWSKVRQASQMNNLKNECREDGTGKHHWESKFRASNPVRSWCFCHETSKSFDDVAGASIRLPCCLWKRQIPEEWTPCSRRFFVPVHTQKGSVWNSEWVVKGSPSHPLPALASSVMPCLCDDVIFRLPREKENKTTRQGHEGITLENTAVGTLTRDGYYTTSIPCFQIYISVRWNWSPHVLKVTYLTLGAWVKEIEQNVDKLTFTLTTTSTRHQIPRSVNCRTSLGLPVFLR